MQTISKFLGSKFFGLYLLAFEVFLATVLMRTPITEFSQNLLKTTIFLLLTLSPIYLYILVYRFSKRIGLVLTIYQIAWFLVYAIGLFIISIAVDKVLTMTGYDIHKIAANILALVILITYVIIQHIFVIRRYLNPPNQLL